MFHYKSWLYSHPFLKLQGQSNCSYSRKWNPHVIGMHLTWKTEHSVLTSNSMSNLICLCKTKHVQHISVIFPHLPMFYTFLQKYQLIKAKKSSKFSAPCALCFIPLNARLPLLNRVHCIRLQGSCSVAPFT